MTKQPRDLSAAQLLRAMDARVHGRYDDPDLLLLGPLSGTMDDISWWATDWVGQHGDADPTPDRMHLVARLADTMDELHTDMAYYLAEAGVTLLHDPQGAAVTKRAIYDEERSAPQPDPINPLLDPLGQALEAITRLGDAQPFADDHVRELRGRMAYAQQEGERIRGLVRAHQVADAMGMTLTTGPDPDRAATIVLHMGDLGTLEITPDADLRSDSGELPQPPRRDVGDGVDNQAPGDAICDDPAGPLRFTQVRVAGLSVDLGDLGHVWCDLAPDAVPPDAAGKFVQITGLGRPPQRLTDQLAASLQGHDQLIYDPPRDQELLLGLRSRPRRPTRGDQVTCDGRFIRELGVVLVGLQGFDGYWPAWAFTFPADVVRGTVMAGVGS